MSLKDKYVKSLDYLFKHTVGKLPYYQTYSDHINIIGNSDFIIKDILSNELDKVDGIEKLKFLDIGARDATRKTIAKGFDYAAIDINPKSESVIMGDICNCPQIPDESFDVVFSIDVFEHLQRPWDAANECLRITKKTDSLYTAHFLVIAFIQAQLITGVFRLNVLNTYLRTRIKLKLYCLAMIFAEGEEIDVVTLLQVNHQ